MAWEPHFTTWKCLMDQDVSHRCLVPASMLVMARFEMLPDLNTCKALFTTLHW